MLNFLLFLLSPLFALAGASNVVTGLNQPTNEVANYAYSGSCWNIENPPVTMAVSAADLDRVHNQYPAQPACNNLIGEYTRVRQNVIFKRFKVDTEGKAFLGGCADGRSAIRIVGDIGGKRLFWENINRKGQKLHDFVFVETQEPDDRYYYTDVYAKNTIVDDPAGSGYQHILDCKTKGGIVPVLEKNSDELPPQEVAFSEIDKTGFETNYCTFAKCPYTTQAPGTIGPTLPPTYNLFPDIMNYLVKVDEEDLPDAAIPDGQIGRLTKTARGKTHSYDVFFHAGAFYLRDIADGSSYLYEPIDVSTFGSVERNPSLQLGVLKFRLAYEWGPYQPTCKPAIYLYPEKPTNMSVKVIPQGYLTKSIPEYNGGWNVKAYPDGTLERSVISGQRSVERYPYLYYEANIENVPVPKEGWVVEKSNIKNQIAKILSQIGLNNKETSDFLSYWVPRLTEKPYYFITLLPQDVINEKERLIFSQDPDTLIRVRFLFEGLDVPMSVLPLELPSKPAREGFVAVDWGGGIVGGNCEDGVVKNQVMD